MRLKAFEQRCTVVEAEKGKKKRLKCYFCNEVFSVITRMLYISLGLRVRKELRQLLARRHDMWDAVRKAAPILLQHLPQNSAEQGKREQPQNSAEQGKREPLVKLQGWVTLKGTLIDGLFLSGFRVHSC